MRHGKLFTLPVVVALLAGCVEEPQRGGSGQLLVDVSTSTEMNVVATRAGEPGELPAEVTRPDSEDFSLLITGDGGFTKSFDATPSAPVRLEVGNYTAVATYGDLDEEGFGKPCFGATQNFVITLNDETPVEMEATLTNMAVSIAPTEAFAGYFADYSVEILRGSSTEPIVTFEKGETGLAFIKPQAFKVKINYTRRLGSTGSVEHTVSTDIGACTWQKLTLDVTDVNGGTITITWNDEMDPVSLGTISVGNN